MTTLYCYRVTCLTTNTEKNTIRIGCEYIDCDDGHVFVLACDAADAANQLIDAPITKIELVGIAYKPEPK